MNINFERDILAQRVAALIPKKVAYWLMMQVAIRHISGPDHPDEVVPDVPFLEVLRRFEEAERRKP